MVVALAACGKGSPSGSSSTGPPATGDAAALQSAANAAAGGNGATFKGTYVTNQSGSSSAAQTIVVEQKPPKSRFDVAGGSVISDGTKTEYCTTANNGAQSCFSSAGVSPVASLVQVFSPSSAAAFFRAAASALAANGAGESVTVTHETYAGQKATCANVSGAAGSGKYCVLSNGVLAAVSSAGTDFQLTNYTTSPPDSDFVLPAASPLPPSAG